MVEVYNLLNKLEFLEEVAILEYEEWADNKEKDKENRIVKKIEKIKSNLKNDDFCKLILLSNDRLIGFISIFPNDCDECINLTPWYATMYVKKEYRGNGYSKILKNIMIIQNQKNLEKMCNTLLKK